MRRTYATQFVLLLATIMLLSCGILSEAAEKKDKSSARDSAQPQPGLSKERVDRIISRLKQTDPEKAEELEKLRAEDPEKFKAELRETMRARFAEKVSRYNRRKVQEEAGQGVGQRVWVEGLTDQAIDPATRRDNEYLEWLGKNYPEQAKMLDELKEEGPDSYREQLRRSRSKYGRIFEASKKDPRLAEVLKEDLELEERSDRLLDQIRAASDEDEKRELAEELKGVVSRRHDLDVKKKQIRHQQLLANLKKLQERINQSQAGIEKSRAAEFKNESVEKTVEKLLSGVEKAKQE